MNFRFFKRFAFVGSLTGLCRYQVSGVSKSLTTTKVISDEYLNEYNNKSNNDGINSNESSNKYLAKYIDHTALKPNCNEKSIIKLCNEAINNGFYSVCVNPCWVSLCNELLKDTDVKVCSVVGFPLGANSTLIKCLEARKAVKDGANEIDMVINIGYIKSNKWDLVKTDIESVVNTVPNDVIVKVILETCLLDDKEIIEACQICVECGVDFVKTSTGFSTSGAQINDILLMKQTIDNELTKMGKNLDDIKIKASGGIRDAKTAKNMINAGAQRIGASKGIQIISDDMRDQIWNVNTNTHVSGTY